MRKKVTVILLLLTALTACSNDNNASDNYEVTKQMVIDVLKTDDGKATLAEVLSEEEMKQQLVIEQDTIKSSIEENLTSDKATSFWKKAFQDPSFAAAYARSLETAHKQLLKDLMKDADYRELLLEVLQDTEMEKKIAEVIKSNSVREELKNTIIETFDSPLVQEKLQGILTQTPQSSSKENGAGESSQTDTGSGGDQGGSGGGGSGGGTQ